MTRCPPAQGPAVPGAAIAHQPEPIRSTPIETSAHPTPEEALIVIPARLGSTRLPSKPLAPIAGRPLIAHVVERALKSRNADHVVVATDSEEIRRSLDGLAEVDMTSPEHPSGTDRVAETASRHPHSIIVNVQGDQPLLEVAWVDQLIDALRQTPDIDMATVAVPTREGSELTRPSVVKVVCARDGRALYFSRAPIPHDRDSPASGAGGLHHVGLYAYRRETLFRLASLPPSPLEKLEKLEQLRALENGIVIGVVEVPGPLPMEVDTPEDLEAVRRALAD